MYEEGVPIYVIVKSPTKIRWVINQESEEERWYAIRFTANALNERQKGYTQVKGRNCGYG